MLLCFLRTVTQFNLYKDRVTSKIKFLMLPALKFKGLGCYSGLRHF